jgi:predicted transcriptional regulator YheO
MADSSEYLENYRRIVRLFGATFREMGIEILLHDLINPSHSITSIYGGEVTGRTEGMGTTKLVIDLKRRRHLNQDKLNYGLEIGARRFKCTTVPILRERHGIVGAICMNIDVNYVRDHVLASPAATQEFLRSYCATDMQLDENILSRTEYERALAGKRHWRDHRTELVQPV